MLKLIDKDGVINYSSSVNGSIELVATDQERRNERYLLQNVAASFLRPFTNPRGGFWRVIKCVRTPISSDVVVVKSPDIEKSYYGNLFTCGSVWVCPVCAAKITERRKNQLNEMLSLHSSSGGHMYMLTLTFSHTRKDKLKNILGGGDRKMGFRKALQHFRDSRSYKSMLKNIGYVGMVRALEVTYSNANGWHPHTHELFLVDGTVSKDDVLAAFNSPAIFRAWLLACKKSGLGLPTEKYGLNIVYAPDPADYLQKFGYEQKWGVSSELTKQHIKTGRMASMTPFDILRKSDENPNFYRQLFLDYANAFFGASQLFFSRGLLAIFGLKSVSDEELVLDDFDQSHIIIRISKEHWSNILSLPFDLRLAILIEADKGNLDYYRNFIG